jgi:hypothetical protein
LADVQEALAGGGVIGPLRQDFVPLGFGFLEPARGAIEKCQLVAGFGVAVVFKAGRICS